MERVYAFTDESGAYGWKIDNPKVSTSLVIAAVLVKESDLPILIEKLQYVREKYFQKGEMKSSTVGQNHAKRRKILSDLYNLPFQVFIVVIDKTKLLNRFHGLHYKGRFYEYSNSLVHQALLQARPHIVFIADEIGSNEYMKSFCQYVERKMAKISLFSESSFMFSDSRNNICVQLADFIAGTFACVYDSNRRSSSTPKYQKILQKKTLGIEVFPKSYESFKFNSDLAPNDKAVAELCFRLAYDYIESHRESQEVDVQCQNIILKYLLDKIVDARCQEYTPTKELKHQLIGTDLSNISTQAFRTRIISNLRDNGVIISSSHIMKGYKIPTNMRELEEFFAHGISIIGPMLNRLSICRTLVKTCTLGEVDLFSQPIFVSMKKYFDDLDSE